MTRMVSVVGFLLMAGSVVSLLYLRALFSYSPLVIAVQALAVGLMVCAGESSCRAWCCWCRWDWFF